MSELVPGGPQPPAPTSFNVADAAVGVIMRPAEAMRTIALARPWLIALAVYLVISLLSGLSGLTAPAPVLDGAAPDGGLPPDVRDMIEGFTRTTRSIWFVVGTALIGGPIFFTIAVGILYLIGRLLGGQGPFSALFSTQAFANIPNLLAAPVVALVNLVAALAPLTGLIGLGIAVWVLVLQVIGIRESLNLSTGRAIATILIPLGILLLLACIIAILVAVLAIGALSTGGTGG